MTTDSSQEFDDILRLAEILETILAGNSAKETRDVTLVGMGIIHHLFDFLRVTEQESGIMMELITPGKGTIAGCADSEKVFDLIKATRNFIAIFPVEE